MPGDRNRTFTRQHVPHPIFKSILRKSQHYSRANRSQNGPRLLFFKNVVSDDKLLKVKSFRHLILASIKTSKNYMCHFKYDAQSEAKFHDKHKH